VESAQDWRAVRVREWLLALLRFAITRNPKDETAALAMADEIDALGLCWRPSAPSFFRRTTAELCQAIIAVDDPSRAAILKSHVGAPLVAASGANFGFGILLAALRVLLAPFRTGPAHVIELGPIGLRLIVHHHGPPSRGDGRPCLLGRGDKSGRCIRGPSIHLNSPAARGD